MFGRHKEDNEDDDHVKNQAPFSERFKKKAGQTGNVFLFLLSLASISSLFIVGKVVAHTLALGTGVGLIAGIVTISIAAREIISKIAKNKQEHSIIQQTVAMHSQGQQKEQAAEMNTPGRAMAEGVSIPGSMPQEQGYQPAIPGQQSVAGGLVRR